jgi:hypothetical protein
LLAVVVGEVGDRVEEAALAVTVLPSLANFLVVEH